MRGPHDVYEEYCGRRNAILRALTTDVEKFFMQCDPDRENLCLYGRPNGQWSCELPAEEVPPELPEPALGINFARDGMERRDWLALVAVHSDSWLLAVAYYKGARLNREQREVLFQLINSNPTIYEVVSGRAKATAAQPGKRRSSSAGPTRPSQRQRVEYDEDEDEDEDGDGWNDGDGDPCPGCGRKYKTDEFWIACDGCDVWWCGRCSKMSASKAQKMPNWKCNKCQMRML